MKPKASTAKQTIVKNPHERMRVLRTLEVPEQYAVFAELSPYIQQTILDKLKTVEIVDLLDHMDMQQAERALAKIPDTKKRERIINRLKGDVKDKMEYFLRFHPQATLSIITFNYVFVAGTKTVGQVGDMVDLYYEETGKYPEILVHTNGELVGEVPLSQMVRARNTISLQKLMRPIRTIAYQSEVSDIIDSLTDATERKLVVVDHDTSVLGIVYVDAAKQLFGNMPAESLYDFAGVDGSERPFDTVAEKVQNRYRWLILNLITTFLASSVILLYQDTLDALTILAIYMPVIAGMGGNAATQSFAIMVRGITLGTISLKNAKPALLRELGAGCINGIIIGAIVALISAVWHGEPLLGLVVAVALIGAHIVAAAAGSFIPIFMKHIGKDPAATSTIFITTITDVAGLFFLLGLATFVML